MATRKQLHFAPTPSVLRGDRRMEGWARVNEQGLPTFPHMTRAEAEHNARQSNAEPVFHDSLAKASISVQRRPR